MPKVYLSPPYHKWNPCVISGCDETTHNNQYLDELEPFLKACKIDYKRGTRRVPKSSEDGTALMNKAIKESNAWGADVHYVSHTNAYDGTVKGYRPMIFPRNNAKGERLAEIMIKHRKKIYLGPVSLVRTDRWAELKETAAIAYYEEHVFHDNKEDAAWFHNNMRPLARATAKALCEYFGIAYVEPYPEKPKAEQKPAEEQKPAVKEPEKEPQKEPEKTPVEDIKETPEQIPTEPTKPVEEPTEETTEGLLRKVLQWLLWLFEKLFKKGE